MPWMIVENEDGQYCVHKQNLDGTPAEQVACHPTRQAAEDQMRALYASEAAKVAPRPDVSQADKERALEEYGDVEYADERNKKYPIDTEEHIRAAWNYIHQERNRAMYSAADLEVIEKRIIAAWKRKIDPAGPPGAKSLIAFGDAIKALGDGKVAGYLVRFGSPDDPDLTGDYFDRTTDFGIESGSTLPVYYNHGLDPAVKHRKIGRGKVTVDDAGIWMEAQLEMRDEYERLIYELARRGRLGWSSGAAEHLVVAEPDEAKKSWHIQCWPIAEASLTPTPAEPRNQVSVKSLIDLIREAEVSDKRDDDQQLSIKTEVNQMTDEIKNDSASDVQQMLEQVAAQAAEQAIKRYQEAKKPPQTAGYVDVVEDEADRALSGNPFKSAGEFFSAVKNAALMPSTIDKRLLPLKATGLNETIPSQGGFLVQPDVAKGIMERVWGVGTLLNLFTPINVTGNGLLVNVIDESSRADGSRYGGVLGYWLEEGGTKVATKPQFRQIELRLKKVAALCYATDELLEDATALEGWINNNVPNELRFKVEDAIINGDGVGKPLGILNSPALVQATRTDANEIDVYDIARMWSSRYTGVNDYVWLLNSNVLPQLLTLTIGQMPVYMPPGGLSGQPYGSIMGRPAIETEYNPGLGSVGDLMLISPSQYALITKGGIQAASSIHVQFVTDETAFRFVYRVDGQPAWNSAVTRHKPSTDSVSPFVALAAST